MENNNPIFQNHVKKNFMKTLELCSLLVTQGNDLVLLKFNQLMLKLKTSNSELSHLGLQVVWLNC